MSTWTSSTWTTPKTFDRVLPQCSSCWIGDISIWWIRNWLDDCTSRITVHGSMSKWKPVTSGVPRGSVLGLILFSIFSTTQRVRWSRLSTSLLGTPIWVVQSINQMQQYAIHRDLDSLNEWAHGKLRAQQDQVQGQSGQSSISMQTGGWMDWGQPCGEGLWGTGRWKIGHEPAT